MAVPGDFKHHKAHMELKDVQVESTTEPTPPYLTVTVIIFGLLATLTTLCSCYVIYKICKHKPTLSLCFNNPPAPSIVPVSVLVVYPAKDSAFQRAVMVLAEMLQLHGGCTVAIDMWQQEKIAELGPMRWLAEHEKGAHRVIIVSPQVESASSLLNSLPNHGLPELSIPAAAHDLYPLILNMVAGHAKSTSELAKFWVVQLSEQKDRHALPPELRSCKTFCLMKDLKKLCRSLQAHRQGEKKILDLVFRPGISYSENSTVKLKEAIGQLRGGEPREMQPLKSDFNLV
ncbi:interleukin-17 receptor B isoform 1-T2 [Odontesthes bonariensis]